MATGIPVKISNKPKKVTLSLSYAGKESEENIISRESIKFETLLPVNGIGKNMLFYGDNFDALLFLMHTGYKGKIRLIYIDPPFATESNFINRKLKHAYSDSLCGGEYVEFLRERLILMRELLSDDGSIYLHLDNKMAFTMKMIMDEIFGENNCRAFITRKKCSTKNYTKNTFGNVSDYIMFYTKSLNYVWNRPYTTWEMDKIIKEYPYIDERTGKRYKKVPIHAPGIRNGETGKEWRGKLPPNGKHWQYTPDKLDELDAAEQTQDGSAEIVSNTPEDIQQMQQEAINIAKTNANNNKTNIEFMESDMFKNINKKYDIIVSNPPYIEKNMLKELPNDVKCEPILALNGGEDGLLFYREIAEKAYKYLNDKGYLLLEIGFNQKEKVKNILEKIAKYKNIIGIKDLAGNDRVIIANV